MMGDLLIAFARIGCPQFVKTFEVKRMEDVPCGADDSLLKIEVAFIRSEQISAPSGGSQLGIPERFANIVIHPEPARC
ncbi:hypothetical protein D3C80_2076470 [compost metagenome]